MEGFEAQRWKSLGWGPLLSAALSAFFLSGCGEKCKRRIGLSACLSEQMNKGPCIVNEGREQKIGLGGGDETSGKEHLVYYPHTVSPLHT